MLVQEQGLPVEYGRGVQPHRGSQVLTLGILSLFFFGIILGPIAWIMANNDLQAMAAGCMDRSGEDMTRRGQACAIFGTIASAFLILLMAAAS